MNHRKILGVIGGMGPQATQCFYQDIIDNTIASNDQEHIDMVIINHASMPDRTQAILSGNTEAVFNRLSGDVRKLIDFGVDYIAMPCNTSHYFIDKLKQQNHIEFIDMIEETAKEIKRRNISKVGLMATNGTVTSRIYETKMKKFGIEVVLPSKDRQTDVMKIIYDQIKAGNPPCVKTFDDISKELKSLGAQAIVLGCTELSYYSELYELGSFFIDAQKVLVRKSIELCGGRLVDI
ncbi:MAG: amino acid racemase [Proteocatella sp.]